MLLLFHEFDVSMSNITKVLGIKNEDAERGSRTLYPLVFHKLRPIWTLLSDPNELYDVWKQCVVCASLALSPHCRIALKVVPFMAIELLKENGQNSTVAHKYHHEVESFIWVFIWVSRQCSTDTGTLREGFLDQLGKVDAIQCAKEKTSRSSGIAA